MDGQSIAVLCIVAVAALYLVRSILGGLMAGTGCGAGGCGKCPPSVTASRPGMIPLEQVSDRASAGPG